jgi:hypothetical protein
MFVAEKTALEPPSFWAGDTYKVRHGGAGIGRIELSTARKRDGADARVQMGDRSFACRVDNKGRSREQGIFSRWLMCEGEVECHTVFFDGKTTFCIGGAEQLQMRRSRFFGSNFSITRASDPAVTGDLRWNASGQAALGVSIEVPESLAIFLLWIYIELDFRATSSL